jgi:hypothetical protein
MKTLKNHVILYDAECPMCKVYTHAFTTTGMLDSEGRAPYQDMPEYACPIVDRQRAVNEIALVDKTTGEVRYGIDSLFTVIGNSCPIVRPLFKNKPFRWLMRKLYAFISYNRKVIIPAPKGHHHAIQPTFKLHYRIAYLVFTWLVVSKILTAYATLLTNFLPAGGPYREYLICGGQILFQGIIVSAIAPAKRWEYLGNMMTISFAGSLLLLPILAFKSVVPQTITLAYFLLVAALMFLEHLRRTKLLSLNYTLTTTWVLYRLLVLAVIYCAL